VITPSDTEALAIVLAGLVLTFLGWRALRVVWFPLFFMLFMVPLPAAPLPMTSPRSAALAKTLVPCSAE
jgi:hypothetical protein